MATTNPPYLGFSKQRRSLLSSQARVQAPWIKVTIGSYTFGVFSDEDRENAKTNEGVYKDRYRIKYPNYVQSLRITKINGQVNQYELSIKYPVTQFDDPNFFEKVFSSVSNTRKIVFSYGDSSMPSYVYKDEEAIITDVKASFDLQSSVISYTVYAVSGAALKSAGVCNFVPDGPKKPSDEIKRLFKNPKTKLAEIFPGMRVSDLDKFIASDDMIVQLEPKLNVSVLDYIAYLVSCMVHKDEKTGSLTNEIYILTLHDDTTYDSLYSDDARPCSGPYFKVTKTSYLTEQSDAYEIDIGFNTSTIVTSFNVESNENYSLFFDYQKDISATEYVERLNRYGEWEKVYAPAATSNNRNFETLALDRTW